MDLFAITKGALGVVNPNTPITYYASTGWLPSATGQQLPQYAPPVTVITQVQELSASDLKHMNGITFDGIVRKVYLSGKLSSIVRAAQIGGDKLEYLGDTWLVVHVIEQFPDWCSVVIQQQVNP